MSILKHHQKPQVEENPLFGLTLPELTGLMARLGQKPYRDALAAEGYSIGLPEILQTARSVDGTERYLIRMADGETVETVWMPDGDGGERGDGSQAAEEEEKEDEFVAEHKPIPFPYRRSTICVSSQVGCAVNCQFCLTAKL